MGVVYKARHNKLKRLVALKMILAGSHAGPDELARFRTEAEAVARLQHPNIVQVYEVGEAQGHPFLALEYVRGGSLAQRLNGAPMPALSAARLIGTLARAVAHAHRNGVVHRDLKPANILMQQPDDEDRPGERDLKIQATVTSETPGGSPKIADFGLAKQLNGDSDQTKSGSILGSPSYMAPEQAEGRVRDMGPAVDVYALGAILYECLTGRPPFRGESVWETLEQVRREEPVPPSLLQPKVPVDLETICLKCLHKETDRRYATAGKLADDLERFCRGEPVQARPTGRLERATKWARRHPVAAALAVVSGVAALAVVGFGVSLFYGSRLARALGQTEIERREALRQRALAETNRQAADEQREEADRQRALAKRYLYFSHMSLAERAWYDAEVGRMGELLHLHEDERPPPEGLLGFEWYYLNRICDGSLRTLRGHTGEVHGIAYSPDGARIATSGGDTTVRVWDAATGRERLVYRGHTALVWSVTFSPDGRQAASCGYDRLIRIWDAGTGADIAELKGHAGAVIRVAFSRDGTRLASAGWDEGGRTVKLWDTATRKPVLSLPLDVYDGVALNADGSRLAAGGRTGLFRVWDMAGNEVLALKGHTDNVASVAFSPDGNHLASASLDRSVRVWDLRTGSSVFVRGSPRGAFFCVAYNRDGSQLAAASGDGTISIWDAVTGVERRRLKGHTGSVFGVAFAADGRHLASCSFDETAKIWDLGVPPEGLNLTVPGGPVGGIAFAPNGKALATAGNDGTIRLWDPATGQQLHVLRGHRQGVRCVAFSRDGKRLVSGSWDMAVRLWELADRREPRALTGHSSDITDVAFSPDGKTLASSSGDKTARLWDVASGALLHTLTGHDHWVKGVTFSPRGERVATCGFDKMIRVWEVASGRRERVLSGHREGVGAVAFSPNGTTIASASADRSVRIWDPATGRELRAYRGHNDPVLCLAFSPDGRRIASAGWDWTVKVWDPETGAEGLSLTGHEANVQALAFSPDGRRLASADASGNLRIWDATGASEPRE
jgi:WD40 repeat protein